MTNTDQLLGNNREYASGFEAADAPGSPRLKTLVVTCMDARIETGAMLGVSEGDVHVLRNAGGVVTDDVIRSIAISQRVLGTREILVIHHTECGMTSIDEEEFKEVLRLETGVMPGFSMEAFDDPRADVVHSIERLRASPFVRHKDAIRGFLYDVHSGQLLEVSHADR